MSSKDDIDKNADDGDGTVATFSSIATDSSSTLLLLPDKSDSMSCTLLYTFIDAVGDNGLFKSRVLLTILLLFGTMKDDDELTKLYFFSNLVLAWLTFVHKLANDRAA